MERILVSTWLILLLPRDSWRNYSSPCEREAYALLARAVRQLLQLLWGEDHVRIMMFLSGIEGSASIRRISRNTGISHRALARRLHALERAGLVAVSYERSNLRLYRATRTCRALAGSLGPGEPGG